MKSYRPVHQYSDTELFAKVSGAPLHVAESMMERYGDNIVDVASSGRGIRKIEGITELRAERIAAALELGKRLARANSGDKPKITSPSDVADLMMPKLRYLRQEVACVLCLNTKGGVFREGILEGDVEWGVPIAEGTVFEGTLNSSVFHPREIFRFAIEESANSIILVHNHPSGDPQPSSQDVQATKQLMEAGESIRIKVLDHIIIGDGIFVSLTEEGFI